MELRHLKYFIRAAELSHFTRAAESLYVSQPALSAQIRQLEEELGTELFARVGRSVQLTEAGQAFLIRAREAVNAVELGEEEVNAIKGLLKGNLHICAVAATAPRLLPRVIKQFQEAYPDVYIKLSSSTSDVLERGVLDGKYCLGFVSMPVEHEELQVAEVFSDEIVVALHKDHVLASRKAIRLADLQEVPMVLVTQHLLMWRGIAYLEDNNTSLKVVAESEELDGVLALIRENHCITLMPKALVPSDLLSIPLDPAPPVVKLGAVWTRLSPAANEFLKLSQSIISTGSS